MAALAEDWDSASSIHAGRFITTCNSYSRGSDTSFWTPWVPTHTHTQIQKQNLRHRPVEQNREPKNKPRHDQVIFKKASKSAHWEGRSFLNGVGKPDI